MHDLKKNGTVFISFQRKQFVLSYSNSNYSKLKIFVSIHTCEIIPDNSMKIQSLDHFFLFFFLIKSNAHDTFFFLHESWCDFFFPPFPRCRDTCTSIRRKKKKKKIRVSMTNHFQRNNYSNAERNFHSLKGMR